MTGPKVTGDRFKVPGLLAQRLRELHLAPMALADGRLLVRDQTQLKCVRVAQ
jgi:hypothetical protein